MAHIFDSSVVPLAFAGFLCLALSASCGGGAPEPRSGESVEKSEAKSSAASEAEPEPESEASEAPRTSSCDDGTCFVCGSGSCLAGWYCDESAPGGAACSWLPECAEKAGCSCVTRALGKACTCTESAGGPHVTCQ